MDSSLTAFDLPNLGETVAAAVRPSLLPKVDGTFVDVLKPTFDFGETVAAAVRPSFLPEVDGTFADTLKPIFDLGEIVATAVRPSFLSEDRGTFVDVLKPTFDLGEIVATAVRPSLLPEVDGTFVDVLKPTFDFGETVAAAVRPSFLPEVDGTFVDVLKPTFDFGETVAAAVRPSFLPEVDGTFADTLKPTFDLGEIVAAAVRPSFLPEVGGTFVDALKPTFDLGETVAAAVRPSFLPEVDGTFVDALKPTFNSDSANAYLVTSPLPQLGEVEFSAGFRLSLEPLPVPYAKPPTDGEAQFNPQYWEIFSRLEQRLRQEVERRLEDLVGRKWLRQRIPQAVRDKWRKRQAEDQAEGREVHDAIEYSDFMDLSDVIKRRNNWDEAFKPVFRNPADIEVSMRRLNPVRRALAHSRPLNRADVLTLVSEVTRIYRALGTEVLR